MNVDLLDGFPNRALPHLITRLLTAITPVPPSSAGSILEMANAGIAKGFRAHELPEIVRADNGNPFATGTLQDTIRTLQDAIRTL